MEITFFSAFGLQADPAWCNMGTKNEALLLDYDIKDALEVVTRVMARMEKGLEHREKGAFSEQEQKVWSGLHQATLWLSTARRRAQKL